MALTLDHVSYRYAKGTTLEHEAVHDVSLTLEPGKIMLLTGATGSGKSTILRLAAGLIAPDGGDVSLDGSAVSPAMVGIVFQRPESQLFAETLVEDVAFGPINRGVARTEALASAATLLDEVGLPSEEFAGRSPFSLSGGQARRAAIAGVLALDTPYLLFDEPSAGLDGKGRRFIAQMLERLRAEGRGIVVVSHDIEEFLGLADDLVLLEEAGIVWSGCCSDAVAEPSAFSRAGLTPPALFMFQERLGCMNGSYSLDTQVIASWALEGFQPPGPCPHIHGARTHGGGEA